MLNSPQQAAADSTRTRYGWFQAGDMPLPADFVAKWRRSVAAGCADDKVIPNPVQRIASRDATGGDYPEILAQTDQAAFQARRRLQALLDAEQQGLAA